MNALTSKHRTFLTALAAVFALTAHAQLNWNVMGYQSVTDYNPAHPGDESEFIYLVENNSIPCDANNLVSFTVHAGTVSGVYNTIFPDGWSAQILPDRTVFSGDGNYLEPQKDYDNTFRLYSAYLGTAHGTAEADSEAHGPFPDLTVPVPAHARPTLALARAATNAFAVAVSAPDATTFLLQYRDTLASTNWTDLRLCAVTGAVTVATDTNAAPSRFYRALVPVP